jgi:hypothetical protein
MLTAPSRSAFRKTCSASGWEGSAETDLTKRFGRFSISAFALSSS